MNDLFTLQKAGPNGNFQTLALKAGRKTEAVTCSLGDAEKLRDYLKKHIGGEWGLIGASDGEPHLRPIDD